ncbi:MAG: RecX family transcriptional regulator [Bryobacteraceae bacterium]|nr:RecX family transcriptional regulator [Bryobacteraceae bacterium]
MRKQPRKLDASELKQYALRLLAGRALSTGELRAKLVLRAEDAATIDPIVDYLRDLKFLDDTRFAQHYTRLRLEGDGHGQARVLRDLRQRKVAAPLAEQTVNAAFATVDEVTMIEQYLARKFKHTDLPKYLSEEKHLAAAYRKLRHAGYGSSNVIRVLRRFSARADEIEEAGPGELE